MNSRGKAYFLVPAILALLAFLITCVFNFFAGQDACCLHLGIFHHSTGNLSDKYFLEITPAGWAFSIWGIIYTYQALWLAYGFTLFCRRNPATGAYLYHSPVFFPPAVYLVMVLNFAINVTWLFVWDREELWWGVLVLFLIAVSLYAAVSISMCRLRKEEDILIEDGIESEVRLVTGFVHNGLGMYAAWTTIATVLNLGSALIYREPHLKQQTSASLCLGILTLEIVIWVILDNIIFQRVTRYLFTPYAVLIWALVGSVDKNFEKDNPVSIFTGSLLVIAIVVTMVKILLVIYRSKVDPIGSGAPGEREHLTSRPASQYS